MVTKQKYSWVSNSQKKNEKRIIFVERKFKTEFGPGTISVQSNSNLQWQEKKKVSKLSFLFFGNYLLNELWLLLEKGEHMHNLYFLNKKLW